MIDLILIWSYIMIFINVQYFCDIHMLNDYPYPSPDTNSGTPADYYVSTSCNNMRL